MEKRKTVVVPEVVEKVSASLVAFVDLYSDGDERDVTKPVGYDADGNPLFAPRGITFRIPWP